MKQKTMVWVGILAWLVGGAEPVFAKRQEPKAMSRYEKIKNQVEQLARQYPDFVQVFSIGENDEGESIVAMRISVDPSMVHHDKIGHLMVSTHHGNELKAPDFTMAFATQLLEQYATQRIWDNPLSDIEWTIVPVLNTTGYDKAQRREQGYDPNRDYPGPCISETGGRLKSIRNMMALMESRIFSGSVTVHGYVGTLTYPWGMSVENTQTRDHDFFRSITAQAAELNDYRYGTSTDIVYAAEGSYEDYAYWKHGMWSLLLELRDGSPRDIELTVDAMNKYYGLLNASPSFQHDLNTICVRSNQYFERLEKRK